MGVVNLASVERGARWEFTFGEGAMIRGVVGQVTRESVIVAGFALAREDISGATLISPAPDPDGGLIAQVRIAIESAANTTDAAREAIRLTRRAARLAAAAAAAAAATAA